MSLVFRAKNLIRYLLTAQTKLRLHSPFVYDFATNVLDDSIRFYIFETIEKHRDALLKDDDIIEVTDLGAGSHKMRSTNRRISEIAKVSLKGPKYGRVLFRLANHYECRNILELGTSFGISTAYLAAHSSEARVYTLEGCPAIAEQARYFFEQKGFSQIRLLEGEFDDLLPGVLEDMGQADLVFLDGNHSYDASIRYFNMILPYCRPESIVVMDDIYWSPGMKKAWDEVRLNPAVKISVDLFELGLLFFREEFRESKHFKLFY